MRLRTKLLLASAMPLLIGTVLLYAGVQLSLNNQTEVRLQQLREQEERAVIERMRAIVNLAIAQATEMAKRGVPDAEILRAVGEHRSGSTYLYVKTFDPAEPTKAVMIMHPTNPALVGRDVSYLEDVNSFKKLYYEGRIHEKGAPEVAHLKSQQFEQVLSKLLLQSGEGVIRHFWNKPKPGGGVTEEAYLKIAYAKRMTERKWQIGMGEYVDNIDQVIAVASEKARADARKVLFVILGLASGILAVNILVVMYFTGRVAAPISDTVQQLRAISMDVTGTADQLSSFSQSLAEGTTEQAASLEEISATLTELSSKTDENAHHTREAKDLTDKTQAHAAKGDTVMAQMVTVIGGIKDSSDRTAKIIKSIDELAFQTNLLALNAAVEAARAGDSGSGFAVVAEEVRNLAQRSAGAAQETARLIQESQDKSNLGVNVAGELGQVLKDITGGVKALSHLIADVSAASVEQAESVGQVSTALAQIDSVTQRTAANAEETSSAGAELHRQAAEVGAIIQNLVRVIGDGDGAQPAAGKSADAPAGMAVVREFHHPLPRSA